MTVFVDMIEQATGPTDETTLVGQSTYEWLLKSPPGNEWLDSGLYVDVNQQEKVGLTYYTLSAGNYPRDRVVNKGAMINGMPFFAAYGKAAHTTADQKQTVSHFTTTEARKPRYHNAQKIGSLDADVIYATMYHDLTLDWTLGAPVFAELIGKGMKPDLDAGAMPTPTYPSSVKSTFNFCHHFKWGADGSESAIAGIKGVQLRVSQGVVAILGANGYYVCVSEFAPMFTVMTIAFTGEEAGLWADAHGRTLRSLLWKMGKSNPESGNAHWFEVDTGGNTAICNQMVPVKHVGQDVLWNAVFTLQNPTAVIQDYLLDEFYEIPA